MGAENYSGARHLYVFSTKKKASIRKGHCECCIKDKIPFYSTTYWKNGLPNVYVCPHCENLDSGLWGEKKKYLNCVLSEPNLIYLCIYFCEHSRTEYSLV